MDGSAFNHIGQALESLFRAAAIALCISVPLAIWKAVDIAIWLFTHVRISWQ